MPAVGEGSGQVEERFDLSPVADPESRRQRAAARWIGGGFVLGVAALYAAGAVADGTLRGFGWPTIATVLGLAAAIGLAGWGLPYARPPLSTGLAVGPDGVRFLGPGRRQWALPLGRSGALVFLWEPPLAPADAPDSGGRSGTAPRPDYWIGTGPARRTPVPEAAYRAVLRELRARGLRELPPPRRPASTRGALRLFQVDSPTVGAASAQDGA